MKKFIKKLENLYAETEMQDAIKQAILDIARESTLFDVENLLSDALSKGLAPDDERFVEKIYKILDSSVVTKRLTVEYGLN